MDSDSVAKHSNTWYRSSLYLSSSHFSFVSSLLYNSFIFFNLIVVCNFNYWIFVSDCYGLSNNFFHYSNFIEKLSLLLFTACNHHYVYTNYWNVSTNFYNVVNTFVALIFRLCTVTKIFFSQFENSINSSCVCTVFNSVRLVDVLQSFFVHVLSNFLYFECLVYRIVSLVDSLFL